MRSKFVAVLLIFSFILFYSPGLVSAKKDVKGNLIGFVYGADKTTPLEGAVVMARNVLTGDIVQSTQTDKQGVVTMKDLDVGIYELAISTQDGDFLVNHLVGIRGGETSELSLALKKADNEAEAQQIQQEKKKRKGILGFLFSPVGLATVLAASAGTVILATNPSGEDKENSHHK